MERVVLTPRCLAGWTELAQRVIFEACEACGSQGGGLVVPRVRELETDCWMGQHIQGGPSLACTPHWPIFSWGF